MKRLIIWGLLVFLLVPVIAYSTGSLTIPNIIGAQPGGRISASLYDANWSTTATYINNREITFGTLASRPAAGTSGRYFYATDTSQYFADNGSAWINLVSGGASGVYAVRGLSGANNSGAPLTIYDFSADQVALRSPADNSITVRTTTGTLSCNTAAAGPVANGRDQAAAFPTNVWLHFYFIWNGTTLATVASLTAPPTGPAFPTGYTAWAYAGFVRYGDAPGLLNTHWRGATMFYDVATKVVHNGASITEQTISVASAVAPNATTMTLWVEGRDAAAGIPSLFIRSVSGSNFIPGVVTSASAQLITYFPLTMPNISQQFFYLWNTAPSVGASFSVTNARMPNGSE